MSELREVLLCEDCQDRHEDDCGTRGCECWCRESDAMFWSGVTLMTTGLMITDMIRSTL